jgi:hypothetical protein
LVGSPVGPFYVDTLILPSLSQIYQLIPIFFPFCREVVLKLVLMERGGRRR